MGDIQKKTINRNLRKARVRSKVKGTAKMPRISVKVSNKHVYAQLIDDQKGHTMATVSSKSAPKLKTQTDRAVWVGEELAKIAKSSKIKQATLDIGWRKYHGRIKSLTESANKGGLKI